MSITFHCEYCGKKIEAQDNAGGKWGKCPACHNKLYVPDLSSDDEELKLAPIDESDEERKKRLMDETRMLEQEILREREIPDESAEPVTTSPSQMTEEQLTDYIIDYLQLMAGGELDQAQQLAKPIISCGGRALKILDQIALSEIPQPQLADIPQQVLSGLIRTLHAKIA